MYKVSVLFTVESKPKPVQDLSGVKTVPPWIHVVISHDQKMHAHVVVIKKECR